MVFSEIITTFATTIDEERTIEPTITKTIYVDILLSYIVRLMVWLSGHAKLLARLGLLHYEEWSKGQPLKILLVGYNGARNTGADARVVALSRQLEEAFGPASGVELTVMTLDTANVGGYFSPAVRLYKFTTMFFFSLLRATSATHVAVLCEGSTLTRTFADALCVFYCEAAGIMQRQDKPCIAYGTEVGRVDGWLAQLSRTMMRDVYFMVRTEDSLHNLQTLDLNGHQGTDTAWTFLAPEGGQWAREQLHADGWDGRQPLVGVAVINPFCWPVRPSLWRWLKAGLTGDHSQQYDKMYFFSDSKERRQQYNTYLDEMAAAVNGYSREHGAFVVVVGMEKLDTEACRAFASRLECRHAVYSSLTCNAFQITGLLRQLSVLVTSRYHAAVLSMESRLPIVAVSFDARLYGVMHECELDRDYLHRVDDPHLGQRVAASLRLADAHREQIAGTIGRHLAQYKDKTKDMTHFFLVWLTRNGF